ncbi:MAG: DEAD/DEAH box helicase [Aphanocapsa feldmannii 277cV]|uniref:DEAD/DEAH box helicase n=3 Tax=Aphanocapsa feldmannii TaxID=192050 RepID=A0A524RLG9_9CHRO|nr:MAG: DEAD/DEAH box helicase [Aphanocapsa feldmannii 277cV]
MSLLHALWDGNGLVLWADTWRVSESLAPGPGAVRHPFSLSAADLRSWLEQQGRLPGGRLTAVQRLLTLPSKGVMARPGKATARATGAEGDQQRRPAQRGTEGWRGLPLLAGEALPRSVEWWPWQVDGLRLDATAAGAWLGSLPLSGDQPELAEELRWWAHLQRWCLSLMARGRWLPLVETTPAGPRGRWSVLINREEDRRRLEDLATRMPQVVLAGAEDAALACRRQGRARLQLAEILAELLDGQMRQGFSPAEERLDPLLAAWQQALGPGDGQLELDGEAVERLQTASLHWREGVAGRVAAARTCLTLDTPPQGEDLWTLHFGLQAEADPSLRLPAGRVWGASGEAVRIGEIVVEQPGELLLEGLGRALVAFEPLARGLDQPAPESMALAPGEAFLLVRTAARKLRDVGVGVVLPDSLGGGLASRLGLAIEAELSTTSKGFSLGESLDWRWTLMIGGQPLDIRELERLIRKQSPLVNHKGRWVELRPGDSKAAESFCARPPQLSLDEALRLSGNGLETLQRLPVHSFEPGPRLQAVLEQYHHHKQPDPLAAPAGFVGQLRPYQERGLGWLAFLHRFDQGACLADDMGLGKTIQLLAFLQYLKVENELRRPVLLVCPTSVITNWLREAQQFAPQLKVLEHYGPRRPASGTALKKALKGVALMLTSYGLLQRDADLLAGIDWQGVVIDEAQAIKNPAAKQSVAAREVARPLKQSRFRIALTGTPVENRVSELWALMDFLNPRVLGEEDFFRQRYRLPIERYGDTASLRDLKRRVGPFILRRLKSDKTIIDDLPDKVELEEWCDLSAEQRKLYAQTVDDTLEAVARAPRGERHGKVLGLLTRLKQICNHPALALKEAEAGEGFSSRSAKLQRLEDILAELLEAGDRALLFTQFAAWGHLLKDHLQRRFAQEVPFLHGGSTKRDRQAMVDRFQQDPRGPQLFLLSLKAGGVGLNLTRASHVLHIDRWWNPAVENQATDRAYRIGQKQAVMVHKFITSGSLEEKIDRMIRDKAQLAEEIVGSGEDWLGGLELNRLRELVSLGT